MVTYNKTWGQTMVTTGGGGGGLQAKGKTSTLEMGELCYNLINANVFVLVNVQNR